MVLDMIIERALADAPWQRIWAGPMRIHGISEAEVELAVSIRRALATDSAGLSLGVKEGSDSEHPLQTTGCCLPAAEDSPSREPLPSSSVGQGHCRENSAQESSFGDPTAGELTTGAVQIDDSASSEALPMPDSMETSPVKDDFPWQDNIFPANDLTGLKDSTSTKTDSVSVANSEEGTAAVPPLPGSPEAVTLRSAAPGVALSPSRKRPSMDPARQQPAIARVNLRRCVFCSKATSQGGLSCNCRNNDRHLEPPLLYPAHDLPLQVSLPPCLPQASPATHPENMGVKTVHDERRLIDRLAEAASDALLLDPEAMTESGEMAEIDDFNSDFRRCPRCEHKLYRYAICCTFCQLDFSIQPDGATPPPVGM